MTQVLVAVVAVLVLAVVALAGLVIRLRTEVRQLGAPAESGHGHRGLSGLSLRSSTARRVPRQPLPSDSAASPTPPTDPPEADAQVAVITRLDDVDTGSINLTTARIASVTLGRPLIKTTAFAYGVRRALDDEHRLRMTLAFRRELRRQRKLRRRRGRTAAVQEAAP